MRETVIVSAVRTPTGKFIGGLKDFKATELGAMAVREAVKRAGIDPATVDECIMGNVVSAGLGQAPARQAAIRGGLANHVGALTINKVCGSGLKAVMLAAQGIATHDIDIAVAGGMESMSNCPYLMTKVREGLRMGDGTIIDSMIHDGLWDSFNNIHMGLTGEHVSEKYHVTREQQDDYAVNSHKKAAAATKAGYFKDEIIPISIPQKKGDPIVVDKDEHPRATRMEALGKLRPIVRPDGTVTAGNASGVNDGAAALIIADEVSARRNGLTPKARILGAAVAGVPPRIMGIGPAPASEKLMNRLGLKVGDFHVIELNEAFAAQGLAVLRQLGIADDDARVNPNGGAIALGHPLGMSGARLALTATEELQRTGGKLALATMCIGVGQGIALALERVYTTAHGDGG